MLTLREQKNQNNELELTHIIAEEIDNMHDRIDQLTNNMTTLISIIKTAFPTLRVTPPAKNEKDLFSEDKTEFSE